MTSYVVMETGRVYRPYGIEKAVRHRLATHDECQTLFDGGPMATFSKQAAAILKRVLEYSFNICVFWLRITGRFKRFEGQN
jgi:hypothetical protein